MPKLISVIVPCYMVEQYIDRCVNSLLNQTIGLDNLELIFVNDASPDNTIEKLFEYEKQYPDSIIVIDSKENMKQGGAKNLGIRYASANYVSFIDSDDWVEPTLFEKLYEKAIQYNCDIVSAAPKRVFAQGVPMGRTGKQDEHYIIENEYQRKSFLIKGGIRSCLSKIYKKDLIVNNNVYFIEHLTYEDNYFGYLLSMYVKNIYFVEEYLYDYFINPESTIVKKNSTHHFDRLITETMRIKELKARNLFDIYHDEIEFSFLNVYYLNSLHLIFLRFETLPIEVLNSMKETVFSLFPDYKNNPYLELICPVYKIFIKTLGTAVSNDEWNRIANEYRKYES